MTKKIKAKSKRNLGTLGEPAAKRLVKAFYEDCQARNRLAILCGVAIGVFLMWSEFVLLFAISGGK